MADPSIPEWARRLLVCPGCRHGSLALEGVELACGCGRRFPAAPTPLLTGEAPMDTAPPVPALEFTKRWERQRARPWIGDEMIAALPAGALVFSAGEGFGELVLQLAQRRPDVRFVAIDLSVRRSVCAANARAQLGCDNVWFCVADVTNLPFADAVFDVAYVRGVLHVLAQPLDAVAELRRVVRERLLVDQLANDPWGVLWFWLLQRYENVRAKLAGRDPDRGIFGELQRTRQRPGTYLPLVGYRRWFGAARRTTVRANCVFVWETGRHHPVLGWLGYAGAIDVWL